MNIYFSKANYFFLFNFSSIYPLYRKYNPFGHISIALSKLSKKKKKKKKKIYIYIYKIYYITELKLPHIYQ